MATTGFPEMSSSAWICVDERMESETGKAVVLLPRGRVLQDDAVRPRRGEDLEAARIGGIQETPLPLDQNHFGFLLRPRRDQTACSISPETKSFTSESRTMP